MFLDRLYRARPLPEWIEAWSLPFPGTEGFSSSTSLTFGPDGLPVVCGVDAHGHVTWTAAGGSVPNILSVEASGMIAADPP